MTGLLVSVRDATEAQAALLGGADIIDIKEPRAGSLGAASPETWQSVAAVVAGQASLSIALGELMELDLAELSHLPADTDYAKIGLANCRELRDWPHRWQNAWKRLPGTVTRVAVCYVDEHRACSPPWEQILEEATEASCQCLLLDTFNKTAGNLLSHWDLDQLVTVVSRAADRGLFVVAAGSLGGAELSLVSKAGVRFLAVRGAVCQPDRTGRLERELVRQLKLACDTRGTSTVSM